MSDDQQGRADELVAKTKLPTVSFELAAYQDSIGRHADGMDEVRQSMHLDGLSFEEARLQLCLSRMAEMNVDALGMPMDPKLVTFDQLRRGTAEVSGPQIEVAQAAPLARWRRCFWKPREVAPRRAALDGLESYDSSFSAFTWSMASSQRSDCSLDLPEVSPPFPSCTSSTQSPDKKQRGSFGSTSTPFTWALSDRYH